MFLQIWVRYQFMRSEFELESFRRSMHNMHLMFAHEHTSTLRIESLTPPQQWAEQIDEEGLVVIYHHHESDQVKPVLVQDLTLNPTPCMHRGWCVAEKSWSSTRSVPSSKEIDEDEVDAATQMPVPPERFAPMMHASAFTHRSDADAVVHLQKKVSCLWAGIPGCIF